MVNSNKKGIFDTVNLKMVKKAGHIILSGILIIASLGLVLNKHYCHKELKAIAIFHEPESCHSQEVVPSCHKPAEENNSCHSSKEPVNKCCNNEHEYVKPVKDNYLSTCCDFSHFFFVVAEIKLPVSFLKETAGFTDEILYKEYRPPLIDQDIPVLIQSFLI